MHVADGDSSRVFWLVGHRNRLHRKLQRYRTKGTDRLFANCRGPGPARASLESIMRQANVSCTHVVLVALAHIYTGDAFSNLYCVVVVVAVAVVVALQQ